MLAGLENKFWPRPNPVAVPDPAEERVPKPSCCFGWDVVVTEKALTLAAGLLNAKAEPVVVLDEPEEFPKPKLRPVEVVAAAVVFAKPKLKSDDVDCAAVDAVPKAGNALAVVFVVEPKTPEEPPKVKPEAVAILDS